MKMWIIKQPDDIEKDRKKKYKSMKVPALYALMLFAFSSIFTKLGFSKFSHSIINPVSWDVFYTKGLPLSIFLSLTLFLGLYVYQLIKKRPINSLNTTQICTKCNKIKNDDGALKCNCGGEFVSIDEMKWIEEYIESKDL